MSESGCDECGVVSGLSNSEIVSGPVVLEAAVLRERNVDEPVTSTNEESIVGGGGAVAGAREIAHVEDCTSSGGRVGLTLEDAPVSEW